MSDSFEIRIELAENGYVVYVPDVEKINKRKAKEEKSSSGEPSGYYGDCRKELVAKTSGEVLDIVKGALSNLPEVEYETAFNEAAKAETK